MAGNDQPSDAFSVLGLFSNGSCDYREHDRLGLRPCMGSLGSDDGMGVVVDRCRSCSDNLLFGCVFDVSLLSRKYAARVVTDISLQDLGS